MRAQDWKTLGWTDKGMAYLERRLEDCENQEEADVCLQEALMFASPLFQEMWTQEVVDLTQQRAQALLKGVMRLLLMPRDLSGTCEETAFLLSRMWSDCPPASPFWQSFSRVVQVAFADDRLASQTGDQLLKRQVHQLRYLLSAYQAAWVRRYMKSEGRTDEQALQAYLEAAPTVKVDAYASARLHNKAYLDQKGKIRFPSEAREQVNFKVLLNFHTEYILDVKGHFLNEVDPDQISQNGIVNGASFNYGLARGRSHQELDIDPVSPWDPPFRKKVLSHEGVTYRAPKNDRGEHGYWSRAGIFAREGKSYKQQVAQRVRIFLKGIPRLRLQVLFKNSFHRFV